MPERIQLSRAKGWRMPPNSVKVDRSTKWGNPFKPQDQFMAGPLGKLFSLKPGDPIGAAGAVHAFRTLMAKNQRVDPETTGALLAQLRGKNLACWCKLPAPGEPDLCHAAVLLDLANREQP